MTPSSTHEIAALVLAQLPNSRAAHPSSCCVTPQKPPDIALCSARADAIGTRA